LIAAALRP